MGAGTSNGGWVRRLGRLVLVGIASAATWAVAAPLATGPAAASDDGVRFQSAWATADEGDTRVTLRVVRQPTVALSEARVAFTTEDLEAVAPSDYVATQGTVVLSVGQTAATVDVLLVDDRVPEPTERFAVLLTDPDDPSHVVDRSWVEVRDDDPLRDPPLLSSSNNRPLDGAGGAAAAAGGAAASPARPAPSSRAARTSPPPGAGATAGRHANRATPFKLYRPAPARPLAAEPSSLSPVASLGLVAALFLACVAARVWHHWRTLASTVDG
jgi:hypothetical protein